MAESLFPDEPRKLVNKLRRLVAERAKAEVEIPASFKARNQAIEKPYQEACRRATQRYQSEKQTTRKEYASIRRETIEQFDSDYSAAQTEYDETHEEIITRFQTSEDARKQQLQEAHWEATALFEAGKDQPGLDLKQVGEQLDAGWEQLQATHQEAAEVLQKRWQWREYPRPKAPGLLPKSDALQVFFESIIRAEEQLHALSDQTVSRLFEGRHLVGLFLLVLTATSLASGFALGWTNWYWIAAGLGGSVLLSGVAGIWLYRVAKRQSTQGYLALLNTIAVATLARHIALEVAKANCERRSEAIAAQLDGELKKASDDFLSSSTKLEAQKLDELSKTDQAYPIKLSKLTNRRDRRLQEAEREHSQKLRETERRYNSESQRLLKEYNRKMSESDQRFQAQSNAMADRWQSGFRRFQSALEEMNSTCNRLFLDWNAAEWSRWTPPTAIPRAIRFARHEVGLGRLEGGLPEDDRLRPERPDFSLPAMLPFPDRSLLLLKAEGEGRLKAIETIRAVMLRMLTSMPPGKVRFTIIDPVGLGENFAAFMHLADYDEQLVTSRIWTESAHIEKRLADLTEHMETVLQVYLRNEFQTIQQYNEFAGELAEPYRVLVAANFPANFSEPAARRLASIVTSGARCGVFTIVSVDPKAQLPSDFNMADLESHAVSLCWSDGRFVWEDPDLEEFPLTLEGPPDDGQFTEVVRSVARRVQDADRVEVPFACAVPEEQKWWAADSRSGLRVPLGRAGAMKLQHLALGKGTSQHVLIAGKTGSGKSTLLHVLITNLAIHYSPDEVEFYLIDFKKGVEFKTYATSPLPHARVIAIESEREFGLSVLERLDAELKKRGDMFRNLSVQDLQHFRAAKPDVRLPRVLLVIDEFQELFVEDDRVSQNAALLLDRLVRQGRAFGIHVLLGSQTLAGAYSLARSTIGQMAVRIALQCSEADAHLILSEENTAARLLTRPGEAIYNDANGLYEGNHPFQVVWLPDDQRDAYLQQIQELAGQRKCTIEPPIVFEGNTPADPGGNARLHKLLAAGSWPAPARIPQAWLGAAVAIKDPTVAAFGRQSGSNLLLVGHREEAALGVLAACLVGLAAQTPPSGSTAEKSGARFVVLDGTRPDAPEAGCWKRLASVIPHDVRVATPRQAPEAIAEVAAEVTRREQSSEDDGPPIYLIVYDLGRFRDLRRDDDDFGFSRLDEDKPPSPARQFGEILREGPALGVHVLVWCDTYNNVSRSLDRQGLRDLEMRVLFQMNATDSSNLMDTPIASQLGIHRAIFYDEGQGRLEKFRPYGLPSDDWLGWIKRQLRDRPASGPITPGDSG